MKYKTTKLAALGEIPEGWKIVKLGDTEIAELIMGQSPPSSSYNEEGEGMPFCQGNTEFGPIYPSKIRLFTNKPMKVAEAGDVLISVRAPVGDVNIANIRLCIGRGLAAIRPNKEKMSEFYLFYQLKHHKAKIERMSGGSTFKAITKKDLENLQIPLPPLPEQQKIAEILSSMDSAIQQVDEAIARTERLKKGLMQELLTKGIGHTKFRDTEIGRIPEEWEVVRLGDENITSKIKDIDHKMPKKVEAGIPFVSVGYMLKYPTYNFDLSLNEGLEYIAEEDYNHHKKRFNVEKNDIIYSRFGSIGIAKLVNTDKKFIASYSIVLLKINKRQSCPLFLVYALNSKKVKLQARLATKGATNKNLHLEDIKNLKLPLPPLSEQKKIAEILSTVDEKIALEKERKAKLERIKKGLMNDLLTGKKRVKVE